MATMALSAAGSTLTLTTAIHLTSTQVEYDVCQFTFDAAWSGYAKTAVFYADPTNVVEVVLVADACNVPWDAFSSSRRYLYVGVYGISGTSVLPTNFVELSVAPGANVEGTPSAAPTPDVYTQLISALNAVSASPAGTYADLAALNAADPDHSKIYITLDDGKWCYYDTGTSAFVAGGTYQATAVADGSVTYKMLENKLSGAFEPVNRVTLARSTRTNATMSGNTIRGKMVMFKPIASAIDCIRYYCESDTADIDITMYVMSSNAFADAVGTCTVHKTATGPEYLNFFFDELDVSALSVVYVGVLAPFNVAISGNSSAVHGDETYVYTDGSSNEGGYISKLTNNPTGFVLVDGYCTSFEILQCDYGPSTTADATEIKHLTPTTIYTYQDTSVLVDTPAHAIFVDAFLTEDQDVLFGALRDRQYIMPSNTTEMSSDTESANVRVVLSGTKYGDEVLTIVNKQTKTSVGTGKTVKYLQIGDSITNGYSSEYNYDDSTATGQRSWAVSSVLCKTFITTYATVGNRSSETVGANTYKAEGRGGWSASNYLFDASVDGVTNPFYDADVSYTDAGLIAAGVKFSLTEFLTVGEYDTPTHIVIQLGANDAVADYIDHMELMIAAIHEQYPAIIIGLSLAGSYGTFHPELYPNYTFNHTYNHGTLFTKLAGFIPDLMALEDTVNGVYFVPTYFVTPSAESIPTVTIDGREVTARNDSGYHPNHVAHLAWGRQIFAWILYTLA